MGDEANDDEGVELNGDGDTAANDGDEVAVVVVVAVVEDAGDVDGKAIDVDDFNVRNSSDVINDDCGDG